MDGKRRSAVLAVISAGAMLAGPAAADHSWSNYHWRKTQTEIAPPVVTAINGTLWGTYVKTAVADWNKSSVIQSPGPTPVAANPRTCKAILGQILVCNERYGQTGWLGIAQIWLSGGHIVQGITKLNDTYFNTPTYNTPAWRALVTCQEIGHDYGLGHQDENFETDLTTSCMDYTRWPAGNEHPDQHDYDQLAVIYNHLEPVSSSSSQSARGQGQAAGVDPALLQSESGDTPVEWGRAVDYTADGRPHVFVEQVSPTVRKVTHVFWTPDTRGR